MNWLKILIKMKIMKTLIFITLLCCCTQGIHAENVFEKMVATVESGDKPLSDLNEGGNCINDAQRYCRDISYENGAIVRCLTRVLISHWDGSKDHLDPMCISELMDYKVQHRDFQNDINLAKACADETNECSEDEQNDASLAVMCLKEKYATLTELCQQEIFRIMREVAYDFRLDAILSEKCEKERSKFCENTLPGEGRIQQCLLENTMKLGKQCKKEVLRQQRETSFDIRLNYELFKTCKFEMSHFCIHVEPGDEAMQMCLEQHRDDIGFSDECKNSIVIKLKRVMRDNLEDSRIIKFCKSDYQRICHKTFEDYDGEIDDGKILDCLTNNRSNLTRGCQYEVGRLISEKFRNIDLNSELSNACEGDIVKFCERENAMHGKGVVMACLKRHIREISPKCQEVLLPQAVIQSENINYNFPLKTICASELDTFCTKTLPTNANFQKCLVDHLNYEHMSSECKEAVIQEQLTMVVDFRLDFKLKTSCLHDIHRYCTDSCQDAVENHICNGKVLDCLSEFILEPMSRSYLKNVTELTDSCKNEVSRRMRHQVADYRYNEVLSKACDNDASIFCLDKGIKPGNSRVFKCLYENYDNLTMACRKEEMKFQIYHSSDIRMMPVLLKYCQMEISWLCGNVEPGNGAVIACLHLAVSNHDADMGPSCKRQVTKYIYRTAANFRLDKGTRTACVSEAKKFCKEFGNDLAPPIDTNKCLIRNYDLMKNDKCPGMLRKIVSYMFRMYQFDAPLTQACDEDVRSNCEDITSNLPLLRSKPILFLKCMMIALEESKIESEECRHLLKIGLLEGNNKGLIDKEKDQEEQKQLINKLSADLSAQVKNATDLQFKTSKYFGILSQSSLVLTGWTAVICLFSLIFMAILLVVYVLRKSINRKGYAIVKNAQV